MAGLIPVYQKVIKINEVLLSVHIILCFCKILKCMHINNQINILFHHKFSMSILSDGQLIFSAAFLTSFAVIRDMQKTFNYADDLFISLKRLPKILSFILWSNSFGCYRLRIPEYKLCILLQIISSFSCLTCLILSLCIGCVEDLIFCVM